MGKEDRKHQDTSNLVQGSMFNDISNIVEQSLTSIKSVELSIRDEVKIHTDQFISPDFPQLILPRRWEALAAEANKRNIPLKPIIAPVQDAIVEVERELRRITETGMGRLLVISGVTGSGKTTFLNSLNLFIDNVSVHTLKSLGTIERREDIEVTLSSLRRENDSYSIVVLEGKETPGSLQDEEIDILLTTLNQDFRKNTGRHTLFVIPTTSQTIAQQIGFRAANIGGMVSLSKPFYVFSGPQKKEYVTIANDTLRALNSSRTLLQYGVSNSIVNALAETSESIGAFLEGCYNEIEQHRNSLRESAATIKRKRIHLWMIFCPLEEDTRRSHDIIRSLTFGDSQHVQVARLLTGDSQEVRYWEDKAGAFAQAAQYLDLRVLYLPMRTVNAIATAYGNSSMVQQLKDLRLIKRQATRSSAQDSLGSTALGAFLKQGGFLDRDPSRRGRPTPEQSKIFQEVVKITSKDDLVLNAAIAQAIRDSNQNPDSKVVTALPLVDSRKLIVDVGIVTPTDIYCLEMKWRSSLLQESEVIRQTAGRVKDYAMELPELNRLLTL